MGNFIANSAAGDTFFTIGGSAISSTTQPRQNTSVFANLLDSSLTAHPADSGIISTTPYVRYTGYDDVSIIRGMSNILQGSANTSIRTQGSDFYRESIHQVDAVRTRKVSSSIRSGFWHEYTGGWSTTPPTSNDFSVFGNDDEADSNRSTPGAFSWAYGGTINQEAYPSRTQ